MKRVPRAAAQSALVAVVAIPLGLIPAAHAADAVELGPSPISGVEYTGRISAVVCSPSDANRYFVGAADGGVWRTTDGGQSWTPLTDDMPTTAIGALALDPTDENTIYVGTGEANYANHSRYGVGLYKSIDGGDTWTQLAAGTFAGRCFARIVVDPSHPRRVFAAVTRAGGFPELAAAKGHPGATGPLGVFRSDDGGVSWTHLLNGVPALSATDVTVDPRNAGLLYAGIGRIFGAAENGVYKSADGGDSWTKLTGLPESVGRISLAVATISPATGPRTPTDAGVSGPISPGAAGGGSGKGGVRNTPSRLYALLANASDTTGGGASTRAAYRSDDGGQSWTSLPLGNIQATYGWYLSVVSVRPDAPDTVLMGGLNLRRSTNAGANWTTVTPPHVDLHAIAWDAAGRLVVGDDGGVHRSANLGNTWQALNAGLGVVQFYAGLSTHPTDEEVVFGGTQDNGTNRRQGGPVWTQVFGGDGGWTQIDQSSPDRVFVEFQGAGNLFRSLNGGGSFNGAGAGISTGDRHCFLPPYVIDPVSPNKMLYGTHRLYVSFNGGNSWAVATGDLTTGSGAVRSLAIAPSDPNFVYAATNDGLVLVSSNGGADFDVIRSDQLGWPRVTRELFVNPDDALTMYLATAAFGSDQVRRTRDGGQTWAVLDGDLPDIPVNVVVADERGGLPALYAGTEAGLYRSVHDGQSWHRYGIGLPVGAAVIDLVIDTARGRLVAATQGRGAWQVPIAVPGDMNGDRVVDENDVEPFILALGDPQAYILLYPDIDPSLNGDMNGDGVLDSEDIDGFVSLLKG